MKTLSLVLLFCSGFFFYSCVEKKGSYIESKNNFIDKSPNSVVVNIEQIDPIVNNPFSDEWTFHFSEIFSNVEYVKLESNENSTIGNIFKLEITKNGDIIAFDYENGNIVRFDSTGSFLNKIGNKGKSKEEYTLPIDMMYDPFCDQIVVYDRAKKAINYYDIDGHFIDRTKFKDYFSSFGIIDDKTIAVFHNQELKKNMNKDTYNFQIFSRDGRLIKEFGLYDKSLVGFSPSSENTFKMEGSRLICHQLFSPNIFTINNGTINGLVHINFGNNQVSEELMKQSKNYRTFYRDGSLKGSVYCEKYYETSNYHVMLLIANGKNPLLYIVDKRSPEHKFAKTYGYNDVYGCIENINFKTIFQNKIVNVYDPSDIQGFINLISRDKEQFESKHGTISKQEWNMLEEYANHTNPIIQICTLK